MIVLVVLSFWLLSGFACGVVSEAVRNWRCRSRWVPNPVIVAITTVLGGPLYLVILVITAIGFDKGSPSFFESFEAYVGRVGPIAARVDPEGDCEAMAYALREAMGVLSELELEEMPAGLRGRVTGILVDWDDAE